MELLTHMRVKKIFTLTGIFCVFASFGQVTDNFNDGDFTSNPTWSGNSSFDTPNPFEIVETDNQLRSQNLNTGSGTRRTYLSVPDALDLSSSMATWSFRFRLSFNKPGSSSTNSRNTSRVYLMSNSPNLIGDVNGYYLELKYPDSDVNEVRLYRQDASTSTELMLSGIIQQLTSKAFVTVMVTRSDAGLWSVTVNNISQGVITDDTYRTSTHFGVQVRYTANSRSSGFYFDDFLATIVPISDIVSPTIRSVSATSDTQISIQFSEDVESSSAGLVSNYVISEGIGIMNAERDVANNSIVHLTTSSLSNGQHYTVTINNVEDLNENAIVSNSTRNFQYIRIETSTEGDVVINEFMSDPNPPVSLPNAEFIELYNKSNKYIDLNDWTVDDANNESGLFGEYIFAPNTYVILCNTSNISLFESFGDVLGFSNFPDLTISDNFISLKNGGEMEISNISYESSARDGFTTELINPRSLCAPAYLTSVNPNGGTPGTRNSVFDDSPDTTLPTVSSSEFTTFLTVNFSEPMNSASLKNVNNYRIERLTIDQVIVIGEFPESVEITFNEPVVLGRNYEVTISGVNDCSRNEIEETTVSFNSGRPPAFNELLITEILFDENPPVGLPEREYIELYNASEDILSTENMFLLDATGFTAIPNFNINPGSYKVLTTTSGASEFSNAMGVTLFPTLNNSGESLALIHESRLIFSINYDPDWHEESKSEGGYSLEMIDFTNPCVESGANWTSSINSNGGTPGAVNSVNNPQSVPDNMPPELLSVTAILSDTIVLTFNEKLNPNSLFSISYSFTPDLSVERSFILPNNTNSIYAVLSSELVPNKPHLLLIDGVSDCNENAIEESTAIFALPVEAPEGEFLLNEVLFNPRTNGVDFVELYNNSDNFITLKSWRLARLDNGRPDDQVIISNEELVMNPGDFLVLTENPRVLLNNYPKGIFSKFLKVVPFPTYSNDSGNVVLINGSGEIAEQFLYNEEYHYSLLEDVDGVSLERVSYDGQPNHPDNWRSASSTEGFATPGYTNSQTINNRSTVGVISPDPKIFFPGDATGGQNFTLINYQFEAPGKFANVDIYDPAGRLVKSLANNELLATSGFLRWDGDTNGGKIARMGYYLVIFEVYDNNGNSEIIKETIVIGRTF